MTLAPAAVRHRRTARLEGCGVHRFGEHAVVWLRDLQDDLAVDDGRAPA